MIILVSLEFFSIILLFVLTCRSCQVNEFLAGAGTDAPDVEENIITRSSVSYDDMWAKTLLETAEVEVYIGPCNFGHL